MPPKKSIEPKEKPRRRISMAKVLTRAEPRRRVSHNIIRSTRHKISNVLSGVVEERQRNQENLNRMNAMSLAERRRRGITAQVLGRLNVRLQNLQREEARVRQEYMRWDDHYQWGGGDDFMPPGAPPPPPPPGAGGGIAV